MSKKILTIQDISCYGSCSITVALPILSSLGVETAILPSAVLSTHTSGFENFTVLDLTDEMPKIISHWIKEEIKFDAIYTGYIGDVRQFDYILECKDKLLKQDGLFIVDPAMADHGKLYPALSDDIIYGMIKICSKADYIIPNITEACFLTDIPYTTKLSKNYIDGLLEKLIELGAKNVILTSVLADNKIGATFYNRKNKITILKDIQKKSYHGTGDIFSSVVIGYLLNNNSIEVVLDKATDFIIDCINATKDDPEHNYGVKFEDILNKKIG